MVYANGVFLILDPGYYEISLSLLSKSNLRAEVLVNNRKGHGFGHANNGELVSFSTILKLADFDSVHVRIRSGKTGKWRDANHFQIRRIHLL